MLLCMVSKLFILQILSRNISYQQKLNWNYFIFLHSVLFQLILIRFFELFQINFFLFLLLSFFSPNVLLVYRSVCVSVCLTKIFYFPTFSSFSSTCDWIIKDFLFFPRERPFNGFSVENVFSPILNESFSFSCPFS